MNITRNVITDLMPLYESGEASDDTRRLIDEFLRGDAEFARLVHDSPPSDFARRMLPLQREPELETFRRTKRLIRLREALFWIAWFLTVAPFTAYDTSWGKGFLPLSHPWIAGALALAAIVVWSCYHLLKRRLKITGL